MAQTDIAALLGGNSRRKDAAERGKHIQPEPDKWTLIGTHLIIKISGNILTSSANPIKVAAFDLDGTLVQTKLQNVKFARGPSDWKWFNEYVVPTLERLHQEKHLLVIFTNQGGVVPGPQSKLYMNFIGRLDQISSELTVPISIFALPKRPAVKKGQTLSSEVLHVNMRKPQTGMWDALSQMLLESGHSIDREASYFVGDAAGRKGDFLDSDKQFATGSGIKFYTPEEVFVDVENTMIAESDMGNGSRIGLEELEQNLEVAEE